MAIVIFFVFYDVAISDPFYWHCLAAIRAWISEYNRGSPLYTIANSCPKFNGKVDAIEISTWMYYWFYMDLIANYPLNSMLVLWISFCEIIAFINDFFTFIVFPWGIYIHRSYTQLRVSYIAGESFDKSW